MKIPDIWNKIKLFFLVIIGVLTLIFICIDIFSAPFIKTDNAISTPDSTSTATTSQTVLFAPKQSIIQNAKSTISPKGTLCNGKRYASCPINQKFYCADKDGECIPSDNIFCNGNWYTPCTSGQFSCSASGSAQCLSSDSTSTPPQPRSIVAKANVGLLCHFKINNSSLREEYASTGGEYLAKASGIIINPQGYILTAKHLIDPQWTNWAYATMLSDSDKALYADITLDYCEVGLPETQQLPTPEQIKTINPSIALVHPFPYITNLFFKPSQGKLSDKEYMSLDFAILKITGPLKDCQTFNLCNLPNSYPYNPVFYNSVPDKSDTLIDFGYPGEADNSDGGAFTNFFLKGAVGYLKKYYGGDKYFQNLPFYFDWFADDLRPGRSGSPVFWNGYVVGIYFSSEDMSPDYYALGMPAIYQILKDNNLDKILFTN